MVLNVHRNHKAYKGRGKKVGERVCETQKKKARTALGSYPGILSKRWGGVRKGLGEYEQSNHQKINHWHFFKNIPDWIIWKCMPWTNQYKHLWLNWFKHPCLKSIQTSNNDIIITFQILIQNNFKNKHGWGGRGGGGGDLLWKNENKSNIHCARKVSQVKWWWNRKQ